MKLIQDEIILLEYYIISYADKHHNIIRMNIFIMMTLTHSIFNEQILNNQIQEQSIYRIKNEDRKILIWIKFHTQITSLLDIEDAIPFAIIRDYKSNNKIKMQFQVSKKGVQILLTDQVQVNKLIVPNNISQWHCISLNKQIQFESATFGELKVIFYQDQNYKQYNNYGYIITWQNKTFSLKAYKNEPNTLEDIIEFVNHHYRMMNNISQVVYNNRESIYFQFYFRQSYRNTNQKFLLLSDEIEDLQFYFENNNIMIEENVQKYRISNISCSWNFLQVYFVGNETIINLFTDQQNLQQKITFKQNNLINLLIGIKIEFFNDLIQIENIIILNDYQQKPNMKCPPNCKKCNNTICLECHHDLLLENYCQCNPTSYFDKQNKVCFAFDNSFYIENENQDDAYCQYGQYYDLNLQKCILCPKLQQYECYECLFGTPEWFQQRICKFQEIFSLKYVELYSLRDELQIESIKQVKFDQKHQKIVENKRLIYDQNIGQIIQINKDIFQVLDIICENNYYLNVELQKCLKSDRGTLSKSQYKISCKLQYSQIKYKCKKCPQFCKICQYDINQKQMECMIPLDGYYVVSNLLKICPKNCPYCYNSTICNQKLDYDSLWVIDIDQIVFSKNCLLYYNLTCLYCAPEYFLDQVNGCVHRDILPLYYKFEFIINQDLQEIHPFQIKNLILQSKLLSDIVKFQIQLHSAQFIQSPNFNLNSIQKQIGCKETQYFNKSTRCTLLEENYRHLPNYNGAYYCPNNKCTHNLILYVTVHISNRQTIIFKDASYFTFQELFSSIKQEIIHFKYIIVNAFVHVFESIDQDCQDINIFYLDDLQDQKQIQFKLILNFVNSRSVFPECYEYLIINFNYIEINQLVTQSSLYIIITTNYVIFYQCYFYQSQLSILIQSNQTLFLETDFVSVKFQESLIEFQSNVTMNIIRFINCQFIDIVVNKFSVIYLNFIVAVNNKLEYFLFRNVIIENLFLQQARFIEINYYCQYFTMENLDIQDLEMRNSYFFLIYEKQNQNSLSIYTNIMIQQSNIYGSYFITDQIYIKIQYYIAKQLNMIQTIFISLSHSCDVINIQFHHIECDKSSLLELNCKKEIKLKQLQIWNSSIIQSKILIINSNNVQIYGFKAQNCNYKPNFVLISIISKYCQIDKLEASGLKFVGQSFALSSLYIIQIEVTKGFIKNVLLNNIIIDQLKILLILHQNVTIQNLELSNILVIQGSQRLSELIRFIQISQESRCLINLIIMQNISINLDQQSSLVFFEGNQGLVQCQNFRFSQITSQSQLYLFSSQNQQLQFNFIKMIDLDYIGYLQQNNSQVSISNLIYSAQPIQIIENKINPLFKNLASKQGNDQLIVKNSIIINLKYPLLILITNGSLIVDFVNISIINYQCVSNLVLIQLSENPNQMNLVKFKYFIISGSVSQQYFIASSNTKVQLSYIFIINSKIGFIAAYSLNYLNVLAIKVINCTNLNDKFMIFSKLQGNSILNHILLLNISSKYVIYFENFNKQQINTVVQNLHFKQIQAQHLVSIINFSNSILVIRYIQIKQCGIQEIFHFYDFIQKSISISNVHVYNAECHQILNSSDSSLIVSTFHLNNIDFKQDFQDSQIIYENSQSYNCTFQGQQVQIQNKILNVFNYSLDRISPITLSLHNKSIFQQKKIPPNILQVKFDNNSIIYFPTGVPIHEYQQFNFKTQQQQQVYQHFAIVSNQKVNLKCYLDQKIDNISGNYANINSFTLKYRVNTIDNFTFLMNPYLNYTYIQNDISCEDFEYVLRFNVRVLPCQLGEYLYQNQCKTCDVNKFQYSVNKKAFLCNMIDYSKIEKAKKGQIKLKPAFWRPSIDNNMIESCNSEFCQGGWHVGVESCVQGQVGALCKECDLNNKRGQGQYAKHDIGCLLCEFYYKLFLQGFIIIIWLMFLVYLSYDTNKQVIQQYLFFKISQRTLSDILMRQSLNQVSVIIKILTNYFFYLYLLKDNLHFLYYQVSVSLNLFNNPAKLISPQMDCILVQFSSIQIQYTNLIFNLITPFYILSSFYFIYMILLYFKVSQFQFNFIIITIYSVYLFNQQLILESQIKLLSSITISGIDWIYLNQQYQFNTKQHYDMIFRLVLPTTLLFVLIPLIIYLQIKRKNKKSITIIKYYENINMKHTIGKQLEFTKNLQPSFQSTNIINKIRDIQCFYFKYNLSWLCIFNLILLKISTAWSNLHYLGLVGVQLQYLLWKIYNYIQEEQFLLQSIYQFQQKQSIS
ncbi:hypothetical protein pb186bvf_011322 [Paramecium bursaria]